MKYSFRTKGVCAAEVSFDMEKDGTVRNIAFRGGCNGNLKAIGRILEGWNYKDIIERTEGNACGFKPTSCADQLAGARKAAATKEGLEV